MRDESRPPTTPRANRVHRFLPEAELVWLDAGESRLFRAPISFRLVAGQRRTCLSQKNYSESSRIRYVYSFRKRKVVINLFQIPKALLPRFVCSASYGRGLCDDFRPLGGSTPAPTPDRSGKLGSKMPMFGLSIFLNRLLLEAVTWEGLAGLWQ